MRRRLTTAAALWLWVVSVQAPFAHYHPEDPGHHHSRGIAHLHLGNIEDEHALPPGPHWDHADDDGTAISQDWSAEGSSRVSLAYTTSAPMTAWERRFIPQGAAPEFVARSHDPPDLHESPARAPPV